MLICEMRRSSQLPIKIYFIECQSKPGKCYIDRTDRFGVPGGGGGGVVAQFNVQAVDGASESNGLCPK